MPESLPNEPQILEAKQAFPEFQERYAGAAGKPLHAPYTVGWIGTNVLATRGAFCVVNMDEPDLEVLVGEYVRIFLANRSVVVYCAGREVLPYQIGVTRRAFMALALLPTEDLVVNAEILDL